MACRRHRAGAQQSRTVLGRATSAIEQWSSSSWRLPPRHTREVVPISLPDEFLDAGALPTLHDRYGLSREAITKKMLSELT